MKPILRFTYWARFIEEILSIVHLLDGTAPGYLHSKAFLGNISSI
jgi:hypothetical protein